MKLQCALAFAVLAVASSAAAQVPSEGWRIVPMTPKPLFTAPLPQVSTPPQVDTQKTPKRELRFDPRPDETPTTHSPWTILNEAAKAADAGKTINCVMPVIVGNTKLDPSFSKPVPPQSPDAGVIDAPKCAPKK